MVLKCHQFFSFVELQYEERKKDANLTTEEDEHDVMICLFICKIHTVQMWIESKKIIWMHTVFIRRISLRMILDLDNVFLITYMGKKRDSQKWSPTTATIMTMAMLKKKTVLIHSNELETSKIISFYANLITQKKHTHTENNHCVLCTKFRLCSSSSIMIYCDTQYTYVHLTGMAS